MDQNHSGPSSADARGDLTDSPAADNNKNAADLTQDVTTGFTDQDCRSAAAMLIATYEGLDHLERLLGRAVGASGPPCPSTRAALVTALQVVDSLNGHLQERDFTGLDVVERVQTNLRAVMGTVGALLCDLTLPGPARQEGLIGVIKQAQAAMDAFSADPASAPHEPEARSAAVSSSTQSGCPRADPSAEPVAGPSV